MRTYLLSFTKKKKYAALALALNAGFSLTLPQCACAQVPIVNPEIAQAGAGTASGTAPKSPAPISLTPPEPIVPDSDAKHEQNKVMSMDRLRLTSALHLFSFKLIRQEALFDQPITLQAALKYAINNNLAIKISKENLNYQRYVLMSSASALLPNLGLSYNLTRTDIQNEHVYSLSRAQLTRISYPVFQGGSVMYGLMAQVCRERGWRQAYYASMNDMLLQVYQNYNNLLLARVLLQIRAKACEVDEEQLRVNQQLERRGAGTRYAVMQSDAQLASDRQALIQQQVAVRQAALALNFTLNMPMEVNLVPIDETVTEQSLFESKSNIQDLIKVALKGRPELREYELFKFAAARNLQVAAAPLYPQLAFFTAVSYTNTTSVNTPTSQTVADAVSKLKTTASNSGVSNTSSTSDTAGAGVFGGEFRSVQNGMGLTWNLNGLGMVSTANLFAAAASNRQAGIQANQELQTVLQQIRSDYLNWRAAREQIDNAAHGSDASQEELRLATLRLRAGVGTNLELIQAQRDYINALTTQAQAIVNSNLAQAQLLHDTGIISTDTLLHGYRSAK